MLLADRRRGAGNGALATIPAAVAAAVVFAGLRFERIAELLWKPTGTATDSFQYLYDRNGNVLYKRNTLQAASTALDSWSAAVVFLSADSTTPPLA